MPFVFFFGPVLRRYFAHKLAYPLDNVSYEIEGLPAPAPFSFYVSGRASASCSRCRSSFANRHRHGGSAEAVQHAVLIIFIVAVDHPSADIVTQLIFVAPMLVLYLVSIGVAWMFGKKRPAEA